MCYMCYNSGTAADDAGRVGSGDLPPPWIGGKPQFRNYPPSKRSKVLGSHTPRTSRPARPALPPARWWHEAERKLRQRSKFGSYRGVQETCRGVDAMPVRDPEQTWGSAHRLRRNISSARSDDCGTNTRGSLTDSAMAAVLYITAAVRITAIVKHPV
jgi:hypothetical protein